jgi:hypothetical protein
LNNLPVSHFVCFPAGAKKGQGKGKEANPNLTMILQVDVYIPPIAQYPSLLVAIILQVNIYIPAPGRPLSGIVRAVVKDSNDGVTGTYLDSDGALADNARRY